MWRHYKLGLERGAQEEGQCSQDPSAENKLGRLPSDPGGFLGEIDGRFAFEGN